MAQRIYHGSFSNFDLAQALIAQFHRGNLQVKQFGSDDIIILQLATSLYANSGGSTALSISLQNVADGVSVTVGKQAIMGVAASLGVSTLAVLKNPLNLINRLDDIAQDLEHMQLVDSVWEAIDKTARNLGSGFVLSDRLNRYVCEYCLAANPPGEPRCIACGAPLGNIQPKTCKSCGYVVHPYEKKCPNCGKALSEKE